MKVTDNQTFWKTVAPLFFEQILKKRENTFDRGEQIHFR